ncbi:MAG: serine protease [Paracoccaceae bacterium]
MIAAMRAPVSALLSALLFLTLTLALSLAPAPRAEAQTWLDQPLDPATMSREDIATLQAALAFTADYYGFTDGVWNSDAQAALETWARRETGSARPTYRNLEPLIMNLENERVKNGWQLFYSETTNTSYLHPFELLKDVENKDAVEFLSEDSGFSVMVRFNDQPGMKDIHDWFYGQAKAGSDPYRYDSDNLWITSVSLDDDMVAYARSDFYNGSWSTISIVVWPEYFNHLNLMAASMTMGGSPATLMWTDGGVIDQVINGGGAAMAAAPKVADPSDPKDQVRRPRPAGVAEAPPPAPEPEPEPPAAPEPVEVAGGVTPGAAAPILGKPAPGAPAPAPEPVVTTPPAPEPPAAGVIGVGAPGAAPVLAPGAVAPGAAPGPAPSPEPAAPKPKVTGTLKGSGTGFYITPTMLVTAAHVIEGCGAMAMTDGTPLEVVAQDASLDLAVLSGAPDAGVWLKLSALEVPKLGETVTALGYPYYTSLDQGLTVTSGNVSALRGIDGSSNRVMITAPVQPGNSGGPLLNKKGAVIGVVVSRVDDMAILEETGSLPQNMNFAVPSGPLLTFLAQSRVTRPQGDGTGGEMSGEVPAGVANAVVPLYCYR